MDLDATRKHAPTILRITAWILFTTNIYLALPSRPAWLLVAFANILAIAELIERRHTPRHAPQNPTQGPPMTERPMDGTGTLLRRSPDGNPTEDHFGGANVHGGYWVQLVDAWPHGRLQQQLDRIERTITCRAAQNRWAAFTNNELEAMRSAFERDEWTDLDGLYEQVLAELARRKDTDGS